MTPFTKFKIMSGGCGTSTHIEINGEEVKFGREITVRSSVNEFTTVEIKMIAEVELEESEGLLYLVTGEGRKFRVIEEIRAGSE